MARVELEHVDKVYPGGTRALSDLTLAIDDGELAVLVGPSGCGKSTVLRLIAGLEEATAGTIRIGDRVVNDLRPQERNVAMVFQDYALYPYLSARGNLEFPLKMRRLSRADMRRRVERVAGLLDISSLLDRLPKQLSGGQRQRIAMGRALVREPAVFLLDEPLSNLDATPRLRASLGSRLTAGGRPEALRVDAGELGDGAMRATVEHVEYLGHETLAHVSVEGDVGVRLIGRVEGMSGFTKGQLVNLRVDASAVHLFDQTGRSLAG